MTGHSEVTSEAGGLLKTTLLFSMLLLKQNNLGVLYLSTNW
jgi:hypothetical protein